MSRNISFSSVGNRSCVCACRNAQIGKLHRNTQQCCRNSRKAVLSSLSNSHISQRLLISTDSAACDMLYVLFDSYLTWEMRSTIGACLDKSWRCCLSRQTCQQHTGILCNCFIISLQAALYISVYSIYTMRMLSRCVWQDQIPICHCW